jgi:hypothetical protein
MRKLLLGVSLRLFKIDAAPLEPRQFADPRTRVRRGLNQWTPGIGARCDENYSQSIKATIRPFFRAAPR